MEIWLGDDVETVFDKRKKPKDSLWVHHTQHNRVTKKNDGGLWCRVVTMGKKKRDSKRDKLERECNTLQRKDKSYSNVQRSGVTCR